MNAERVRAELIDALRHPEELGVGFCPACDGLLVEGEVELSAHAERLARLLEDRAVEVVIPEGELLR